MSDATTLSQAERDRYRAYDERRRRSLLGVMVPAGVVLSGLASLVATVTLFITPHQDASVWVNDAITLVLAGLFVWAWHAVRQGLLTLASGLVAGAGCLGVLATVAIAGLSQGLTPLTLMQMAFTTIVVVMVGTLGNLATIVGAAALLNAVTLSLLLWAPRPPVLAATIQKQLPLLASVSITYQWGVAALMVAIWLTYRQTLSALGAAYERAQQLDGLKAQFITHINHELRTPIMTLQGYVEYLRLGHTSLPDGEIDSALQRAGHTADTLVTLLNNILDIRRIETNQISAPQAVRVRAALDAALPLVDPRLGGGSMRDLRLAIPDEQVVWGDPVAIQQILVNLLANALKYSSPGTAVEVSACIVEEDLPAARRSPLRPWRRGAVMAHAVGEIGVRDYGHGIPPDQIPLLFNRFARLPRDLASKVGGSGLGLYLCRVFAEAMGGTIHVESTGVEGEGSIFRLRLPLPPDTLQAPVDRAVAAAPGERAEAPWPAAPTEDGAAPVAAHAAAVVATSRETASRSRDMHA
jgi:signal transduction histidine kinase